MSTRDSIWFAEDKGKSVHIYWELAERTLKPFGAPVFITLEVRGSNEQTTIRLLKDIARAIVAVLAPNCKIEIL